MSTQFRFILVFAVCVALLVFVAVKFPLPSGAKPQPAQAASAQKQQRRPTFVPGEVLVRYRSESLARSKGASVRMAALDGTVVRVNIERLAGDELVSGLRLARVAAEDTLKTVAAMRQQPDVLYAEPNYILKADRTANDPFFLSNQQYAPNLIGLPQPGTQPPAAPGAGKVVIGVIDQGIDFNHADLAANIWINPGETPGNGIDDDGNGFVDDVRGFNFVNHNGTIFSGADTENHATHVAGIAGGVGNNGIGVAGVNWTVGLMSLKFLDAQGFGSTAGAIRGVSVRDDDAQSLGVDDHAKGANVRVLNASFGGGQFSQAFVDAVGALNTAGILFVAAAGNVDNGTKEPNNDLIPHFPSASISRT
jgi:hypothetical protein